MSTAPTSVTCATAKPSLIADALKPGEAGLPKVVVITGPTAVGKTAVGLALAEALGGEVISADSVQVYRGLDIGSDKLPVPSRRGIPHHLLDVRDVCEDFSAGDFHDLALQAAKDITARGKVPVVVGGTGFYLQFMMAGKPQGPKATPKVTAHVEAAVEQACAAAAAALPAGSELSAEGRWDAAVELLRQWGDTQAAERIGKERNNWYRLKRALSVVHMTRKTLAELDVQGESASSSEFDFRCFFLHRNRLDLYRKIARRCEEMVFGGLLDEAVLLLQRGIAPGANMATRAIGYRQAMEALSKAAKEHGSATDSSQPTANQAWLEKLVLDICFATHKLVKSQMTWFRDDDKYTWIDMDALEASAVPMSTASEAVSSPASLTDRAVDLVLTEMCSARHKGLCPDTSGRLNSTDDNMMKRYVPKLELCRRPSATAKLLAHVNTHLLPLCAPQPTCGAHPDPNPSHQANAPQAETTIEDGDCHRGIKTLRDDHGANTTPSCSSKKLHVDPPRAS